MVFPYIFYDFVHVINPHPQKPQKKGKKKRKNKKLKKKKKRKERKEANFTILKKGSQPEMFRESKVYDIFAIL